jgi:hypothetical protein
MTRDLTPHDPDVCSICKLWGLTKEDWTKGTGEDRG